jgi:hypothetical protein
MLTRSEYYLSLINKKPLKRGVFYKGQKGGLSVTGFNGDFRNWEKSHLLALVFAISIKGIKNGKVRIT